MKLKLHSIASAVKLVAFAGAAGTFLSACSDVDAPVNTLPAGITQQAVTNYPAVATGAGDTATTKTC